MIDDEQKTCISNEMLTVVDEEKNPNKLGLGCAKTLLN
jgi:hypothetical protein